MWQRLALLAAAIGAMFLLERAIPWQPDWNRSHGDALKDFLHGVVNTGLNYAGLALLPLLAHLVPQTPWPAQWPFWLQVIFAIVILDAGISLCHWYSHRAAWLWPFHAVHHGVRRLYGFNGLMKHPVHQLVETGAGMAPLLVLGIPPAVAGAVASCVAIQLLLQHANADYRSGPLKYLLANAEVHRFHHRARGGEGDVNFGLFLTVWDFLLGTFRHEPGGAPRHSHEIGVENEPDFPQHYLAQLKKPFSA